MSFLFFCFLFFHNYFFCALTKTQPILFYTGIIELHIRPDRRSLQEDLSLLDQYIKEQKVNQPRVITEKTHEKNGLDLYKKNKSEYSEYKDIYYALAEKVLHESLKGIQGVYAFYRGYNAVSDKQGSIIFPRLETNDELGILLTPSIHPIIVKGAVPDHFIVPHETPYVFYQSKAQKTEDTMQWPLSIRNDKDLKKKIPFNTLIILLDPGHAFFDKNSPTMQLSNNIILPTLYIIENKENNLYAHFALDVLRYYKPLAEEEKTTTIANQSHYSQRLKDY